MRSSLATRGSPPGARPPTAVLDAYFGPQLQFWAKISTMPVLGILPVFFAVATLQRYLVRGISMGVLKG